MECSYYYRSQCTLFDECRIRIEDSGHRDVAEAGLGDNVTAAHFSPNVVINTSDNPLEIINSSQEGGLPALDSHPLQHENSEPVLPPTFSQLMHDIPTSLPPTQLGHNLFYDLYPFLSPPLPDNTSPSGHATLGAPEFVIPYIVPAIPFLPNPSSLTSSTTIYPFNTPVSSDLRLPCHDPVIPTCPSTPSTAPLRTCCNESTEMMGRPSDIQFKIKTPEDFENGSDISDSESEHSTSNCVDEPSTLAHNVSVSATELVPEMVSASYEARHLTDHSLNTLSSIPNNNSSISYPSSKHSVCPGLQHFFETYLFQQHGMGN
ncbi:hypothetical protein A0H81_15001 [Grifola frondosa]|uniref:Uncharacterized protein n=1 Tax=Grifola frondosa TaxID=5627 RepID=A0A1C7LJR1_GRIFR|nr:hypothetical protein A0H81_15001 [Grifola frondosa]